MSAKAQTARNNGARSQGPITPEGKAISARNSTKHGLSGGQVVLEHESQEDFDRLLASILGHFTPVGAAEEDLLQEMAAARWRLRRIDEMETAVFTTAIRRQMEALGPDADPREARTLAYVDVAESKSFRMLSRYRGQLRRGYEKACQELESLQQTRRQREAEQLDSEEQNEPTVELTESLLDAMLILPQRRTWIPPAAELSDQCRTL